MALLSGGFVLVFYRPIISFLMATGSRCIVLHKSMIYVEVLESLTHFVKQSHYFHNSTFSRIAYSQCWAIVFFLFLSRVGLDTLFDKLGFARLA